MRQEPSLVLFAMVNLSQEVLYFFKKQGFVIVSTLDKDGSIHNACKDIVRIGEDGKVYLLDLFMGRTYRNLTDSPVISITAADEHSFSGYSLKGRARIIPRQELEPEILEAWNQTIISRASRRLIKNIRGEKGHHSHPEVLMPKPKYMIRMDVEKVIDLTPKHLK